MGLQRKKWWEPNQWAIERLGYIQLIPEAALLIDINICN
jgi:hypothetical protein